MPFPFSDVSDHSIAELLSLRGRVAVVTGAAQGLGRAIAERLAEAGAKLVLADLNEEKARTAASEIARRFGAEAIGTRTDVSDKRAVEAAADLAVAQYGSLDIWINNAGLFPGAPALQLPEQMWDQVFAVNAKGVLLGAQAAGQRMASANSGGVIINVISTAGFHVAFPGMGAYVASKHAARGLTKSLAVDLAPLGIRVLGVAPTYVPTEGNIAAAKEGAATAKTAGAEAPVLDVMSQSLIGRLGTPDDIARVVLFAASDMATIMTGSTLLADAGETL